MSISAAALTDVDAQLVERVRLAIYRQYATTGAQPHRSDVATALGLQEDVVDAAFTRLAEQRHIALDVRGDIVMAHPFASTNLGFSVMGDRTLWWGGCAWDSFAVPHLVPGASSVLVATTCPGCGAAHAWTVTNEAPPAGDQLAHFLVPTTHIWDDVVHACGNQRIFCGEVCIASWLAETGNERGSVFDLATLWRLASRWYEGRLDSPYTRREPIAAAAYFAEVGLSGAFWGLPD
ncbi:organomercurial lyase [Plantibacter sp. Mn2098]|uniref:organomercurial lyase n=1 Tax=Plantibacter sp. Mn2098 TaxID=3395266 RepID=UPI003BD3BFFA